MKHTSATPGKPNKELQPATLKNEIGEGLDREEMITVAAYYHAEHRGFVGGDSLADWLSAEAGIDAIHKNSKDIKVH